MLRTQRSRSVRGSSRTSARDCASALAGRRGRERLHHHGVLGADQGRAGAGPGRLHELGGAVAGAAHPGAARRTPADAGRLGGVHDVARVVGRGDAQRDAQVGVGPDRAGHHARGPLGGEQEVHAERPAALGEVDHAVDELGHLLGQRRELVDADQQAGRRRLRVLALELDQVLDLVAAEQLLAGGDLGPQRGERAGDQSRVEVGDVADRVRQVGTLAERRTALVVDEQEGDPLGRVVERERADQRLQQLALAGPGGPGDQAVRTVLAQVHGDGAVHAATDLGAQPRRLLPAAQHRPGLVEVLQVAGSPRAAGRSRGSRCSAAAPPPRRRTP